MLPPGKMNKYEEWKEKVINIEIHQMIEWINHKLNYKEITLMVLTQKLNVNGFVKK